MKDVPQRHERIYITRQHLISLSFTTLGIAVLTFALGYKVGYSRDISTEDSESILLLPDIQKQQTLESLLRQIERTEKKQENLDFSFPDEDSRAIAIRVQDIQDQPSELVDSEEEIETPKFTEQEIPSSGWSVQVGSYTTLEEAQDKIKELQASGHQAYYIIGLVNGENWYRVRVGGFATKTSANSGLKSLERTLSESGFIVSKAP